MNMDGTSGSQLRTPPWGSLTVGVVFPREMTYVWTLLQAHTKGLKVGSDGVKDIAGEFTPPLHRSLEDLATRFLCSTFRGRPGSLICILFSLSLFLHSFPISTFWRGLHFRPSETEDVFPPIYSLLPFDAEK
jgi:hypothetical protein